MSIDATSRLRAWIRDFGDMHSTPHFVADVEAVLDSNAELLAALRAIAELTPQDKPGPASLTLPAWECGRIAREAIAATGAESSDAKP